jgi:hypothetical protein
MITKAWVIYFIGQGKEKPGICWWGNHGEGMVFESRNEALKALKREFTEWDVEKSRQKCFKVMRCAISLVTPVK